MPELMQLDAVRLKADKHLREFCRLSFKDPEEMWELAMTAQSMPDVFERSEEGRTFWRTFLKLRDAETSVLKNAVHEMLD